jgi:alpha,alpha-trehalose phosphorylase
MDLHDLEHNVRDGLHMGSLAGVWLAAVGGFGGMRDHDGKLSFTPRLPASLENLVFRITYRGRRLRVAVVHHEATYVLTEGLPMDVTHYGKEVTVSIAAVTVAIPPAPKRERPTQPPGRAPTRRGVLRL